MDTKNEIKQLVQAIPPISPDYTVDYVGELLLSIDEYKKLLSLPIIDHGVPAGVISRYQLMNVFLNRFGRELHGKRKISEFMNPQPLMVNTSMGIEAASQYLTENMNFPITEDFIFIDEQGQYQGVGMVLDLLRAMEQKVSRKSVELSKAYKNLKDSQAQLIQSEKMASLGQMVAGIAHEINTPLGYVKNNIESVKPVFSQLKELSQAYRRLMTEDEASLPQSEAQKIIETIETQEQALQDDEFLEDIDELFGDTLYGIAQISELVLGLKDFSRLDKARVDEYDINECVNSALIIGRNNIKYKAEVIKELAELPKITCSPSQINQVILNMLNNAAHAIEDTGTIKIATYADDDDYVNIDIQDDGVGIEEKNLKKIFDPFFTTKKIGEGSGMGLSISYKIIQQHNGKVKVSSKPGVGTRFIIRLPINNGQQAKHVA